MRTGVSANRIGNMLAVSWFSGDMSEGAIIATE